MSIRGINKEDAVHIYNRILAIKEWNNAICSKVDGPRDCHTEWSKSDRERQSHMISLYMWNLKNEYKWTYIQNRNRITDEENKHGYQGLSGGMGWIRRLGWTYPHYYI